MMDLTDWVLGTHSMIPNVGVSGTTSYLLTKGAKERVVYENVHEEAGCTYVRNERPLRAHNGSPFRKVLMARNSC